MVSAVTTAATGIDRAASASSFLCGRHREDSGVCESSSDPPPWQLASNIMVKSDPERSGAVGPPRSPASGRSHSLSAQPLATWRRPRELRRRPPSGSSILRGGLHVTGHPASLPIPNLDRGPQVEDETTQVSTLRRAVSTSSRTENSRPMRILFARISLKRFVLSARARVVTGRWDQQPAHDNFKINLD